MFLNDEKASIRITQKRPQCLIFFHKRKEHIQLYTGSQETIEGSFLNIVDSLYEAVLGDRTHICAILSFYCNYQVAQNTI